jgi:outer membrane protein assembly factor BamB
LHAVDTANGKALWQFGVYSFLPVCPAIGRDGTLYLPVDNGYFYALNPDGTVKWREVITDNGYGSITCIPSIGPDGTVYQYRSKPGTPGMAAFDPATGEELWRCTLPGDVYTAEVVAIRADGTLFIGGNVTDPEPHSAIYAINGATGEVLWNSVDTAGYVHIAPCIDAAGKLYVTTSSCKLACLSGTDGSEIWRYDLPGANTATPSIGPDGTLYVASTGGLLAFCDP